MDFQYFFFTFVLFSILNWIIDETTVRRNTKRIWMDWHTCMSTSRSLFNIVLLRTLRGLENFETLAMTFWLWTSYKVSDNTKLWIKNREIGLFQIVVPWILVLLTSTYWRSLRRMPIQIWMLYLLSRFLSNLRIRTDSQHISYSFSKRAKIVDDL